MSKISHTYQVQGDDTMKEMIETFEIVYEEGIKRTFSVVDLDLPD